MRQDPTGPTRHATPERLERAYAGPAVQVEMVGQVPDSELLAGLERAFARFGDDPLEQFRVRLKRQRAAQLRLWLAQPEPLTVEAFNRELWLQESETRLRRARLTGKLFGPAALSLEQVEELEEALEAGVLELHGNYLWTSGKLPRAGFYTPLKDQGRKLALIRQALKILNNPRLKPLEQARRVDAVHGFGPRAASGLVLIRHPQDFALRSPYAAAVLHELGYRTASAADFQAAAADLRRRLGAADFIELDWFLHQYHDGQLPEAPPAPARLPAEPELDGILAGLRAQGYAIDPRTLRRYHLALQLPGFVVLSGVSGVGKTWLTRLYATAVEAEYCLVAVAPNWTANEDLLGYFNPLDGRYHDTRFSRFLRQAAAEYAREGDLARQYHLALDEMNLARVEHYFARFLSALEVAAAGQPAAVELGPGQELALPPNLRFVGTVNLDETTHGFADKVFDRAQVIELQADRADLARHLGDAPYAGPLLDIRDALQPVAPFAYRALDRIRDYVAAAAELGVPWQDALDEQLLQQVLPRLRGAAPGLGDALARLLELTAGRFPLSQQRAARLLDDLRAHGFTSFF